MSRQISINLDEGKTVLNDMLKCSCLLDKITVCKDCGCIHFLPPERTNSCSGHKQYTLKSALEQQKNAIKRIAFLAHMKNTVITILCLLAVWMLNTSITIPYSELEYGLLLNVVLKLGLIIMLILAAIQLACLVRSQKIDLDGDSIYAFLMRNYVPKISNYQGESWEHAVKSAYAFTVGKLEMRAQQLNKKKQDESEEWENLYADAMELSYCCDCEALALLRLSCLSRMRKLPNTYTDIRQIILLLSPKVLIDWLEQVVDCLERLCVPCDRLTAWKFLHVAENFYIVYAKSNPEVWHEKSSLWVRGIIAIGPFYALQAAPKSRELQKLCQEAAKKDEVFAYLMEHWNAAG